MKTLRNYFVTGTDTEVGKTFACCALLHRARLDGLVAVGMKPVAAGTVERDGRRVNEDVLALADASSFVPAPDQLNPYCFAEAIAPHIAAARAGVRIDPRRIIEARDRLLAQAELVLIEGVGGFRVPLGFDYDTARLAVDLASPVILVVGLRLGCINHALLTIEAIALRGLHLAGWIANCIDPQMARRDENLAALRERIGAPLLGLLPHGGTPATAALALHLPVPARLHPEPILVLDSAAELTAAHRDRVVITGSHGGLSAARYALAVRPALVFFNDAGGGKDGAGIAGLALLDQAGLPAVCYSHESARIGDGRDAFGNGRISHVNGAAGKLGVTQGEPVVAAATRVADAAPR